MTKIKLASIVIGLLAIWMPVSNGYFASTSRISVPSKHSLDCVYFSGAGIYFWWQAGAAKYLRQHCDLSQVPVLGASAGSLTSSLLLSGVDFDYAADSALALADQFGVYDKKSSFVFWGPILRNWLEQILPDTLTGDQLKLLQIAITPASPFKAPQLVSGFETKVHLIEAIMASCHVPLFLDGKPFTTYRGEQYLDGSFWYFVTKDRFTGLPLAEGTKPEGVFWVDYCDDEEFMQSISGNILETVSPATIKDMMAQGFRFMEAEHEAGRLPIARESAVVSFINKMSALPATMPPALKNVLSASSNRLYSFAFQQGGQASTP